MTAAKRDELYNLIQFVTMAYKEPDINEQYRDVKKEKIARLYGNTARAKLQEKYLAVSINQNRDFVKCKMTKRKEF